MSVSLARASFSKNRAELLVASTVEAFDAAKNHFTGTSLGKGGCNLIVKEERNPSLTQVFVKARERGGK